MLEQNLIGHKVADNYRIERLIGRGGMGAVYEATDERLQRQVAIKVVNFAAAGHDKTQQERFVREARSMAKLEHSNILPIYDFVVEGDNYYMVMKYVHGRDLDSYLAEANEKGETLPKRFVAKIIVQVARALDYADNRGIVHRDVKPGNVMVTDDDQQALLMDFGIAKWVETTIDGALTRDGTTVGTPVYMSPEQIRNKDLSGRSDQYSLAVLAYQMLAGQPPFQGETIAVMQAHLATEPPSLAELNPNLPPKVWRVIQKALAKDPKERYPRASDFALALSEALLGASAEVMLAKRPLSERIQESRFWGLARRAFRALSPGVGGVLGFVFRTVLLLIVVGAILLGVLAVGGSYIGAAMLKNAIARTNFYFQSGPVALDEAEVSAKINEQVAVIFPDLAGVQVDFTAPDLFTVSGVLAGRPIALEGAVHQTGSYLTFSFKRANDVPLLVVGGILAGGVNSGLQEAMDRATAAVVADSLVVTDEQLQLEMQVEHGALVEELSPAELAAGASFSDDFEDPTSGWPIETYETHALNYIEGVYKCTVANPGLIVVSPLEQEVKNFEATVEVFPAAVPGDSRFGLIFRIEESSHYYGLMLEGRGRFNLLRFGGAEPEPLAEWHSLEDMGLELTEVETIGVRADGSTLTAYVNGVEAFTVEDDAYDAGFIGFRLVSGSRGGLDVAFDNLEVQALQ